MKLIEQVIKKDTKHLLFLDLEGTQFEHEIIATALAQNNENRTQTAKLLKISRRHLVRKLEGYRKRDP